ncbi:MAG TPA: hypothetical protein VER12_21520 [Polyangiaceae bacterium]|nr:hypothetical protein [Polyangiaceae bacterium]
MRWLGGLSLACYAIHVGVHLYRGRFADALWGCHVASLLIAAGAFSERATPAAIGVLWLCFGNPIWLLDIATGGEFLPTSLFTHLGGFVIGILALRRLGVPPHVWWKATLAFLALLGLTRLLTPRASNINLAFAVAPGWEATFPSYPLYLLLLISAGAVTFFAAELGLRKVLA